MHAAKGLTKSHGTIRAERTDCGVLVCVFVVLTRMTHFGRCIYAVGGNERAALLAGLPVDRIQVAVYTLGGLLAGAAGLIVTARLDSAQSNAG